MEAVPALAIGRFAERTVAQPLRASFASIWIHRMPEAVAPPVVVTPDGTVDLQWIDGCLRVAGPDRDPKTEILPARTIVVGFRFHPAAAAPWLRASAIDLRGKRLSLEDLWGAKAKRLAGGVHAGNGIDDLVHSLERLLVQCTPAHPVDTSMHAAFNLIKERPPADVPLIFWLQRTLAMSERTLRRRFDESFGYGPKTLDRILRYQRFLDLSRRSRSATAILAVEAGYSDQAHLIRESRRLSGITPLQAEQFATAFAGARRFAPA